MSDKPKAIIKARSVIVQKEWVPPPDAPPSIDLLMAKGLTALERTLNSVMVATEGGLTPDRNTILNLKDCMFMLHDLKKAEKEILEALTDEELERLAKQK